MSTETFEARLEWLAETFEPGVTHNPLYQLNVAGTRLCYWCSCGGDFALITLTSPDRDGVRAAYREATAQYADHERMAVAA